MNNCKRCGDNITGKGHGAKYCDTCYIIKHDEDRRKSKKNKYLKLNKKDTDLGNPEQDNEILLFLKIKRNENDEKHK